MSDTNQTSDSSTNELIGDAAFAGRVAPAVEAVKAQGGQRAFCSVWDLHAYYGESYIVQGVSFDIREGEIVALLGRNGAGKTSTLRALARVDDPELRHGEIWLDHKPLHEMSSHEAARNGLGMVDVVEHVYGDQISESAPVE